MRQFEFEKLPGSAPVKNFRPEEFDDPTAPGTGDKMDERLIRGLDQARDLAGIPFIVESGARTVEHNTAVGGRPKSAHMLTENTYKAVDLKAETPQRRFRMLHALLAVGFDRLEIKRSDIHVDVAHDDDHPVGIALFFDTKTGSLV